MTPREFDALDDAFVAGYAHLVRLASLIVGADGEDAVMEAFVRVRSRPRPIDDPAAYLRTAVLNECRSRWRRDLRRPRMSERSAGGSSPEVDTLWEVLARLPPDQRAVVALRFYEDLTIPQIAEALDMRDGTVKSHLHRAKKALHSLLGDEP